MSTQKLCGHKIMVSGPKYPMTKIASSEIWNAGIVLFANRPKTSIHMWGRRLDRLTYVDEDVGYRYELPVATLILLPLYDSADPRLCLALG